MRETRSLGGSSASRLGNVQLRTLKAHPVGWLLVMLIKGYVLVAQDGRRLYAYQQTHTKLLHTGVKMEARWAGPSFFIDS